MKKEKRFSIIAIFVILLATVLTACGSSGGGSGTGSTANGLAKSNFKKNINYSDTVWFAQFGSYTSFRSHHLYHAEDIKGSGNITALRFRYDSDLLTDTTCNNTTIKLGHTNVTDLTTTFNDAVETGQGGFVTVIDNTTVNIPTGAAGEFFEIPLTGTFNYNGVDNLLLEISRTSACSEIVYLDAGSAVGYTASVIATSATEATGLTTTANITISFKFSGGDNELNFAGAASTINPFSVWLPRVQTLYRATEIDGSGPISGVAFQMDSTSLQNDVTYTLKLGHTTFSALSSSFDINFNSGTAVTVANAINFTIPAGLQGGDYFWVPIPDGIFTYNGTDNLLVEVDVTAATGNTDLRVAYTEEGRRVYENNIAGTVDTVAPHIKLRFKGAPVQIMPAGNTSSSQVLGGRPITGAGQVQSLYTADLVGTGGTISSISLRLTAGSVAATISDYKIYMGATNKTAFNVADIYSSNMELSSTLVFNGNFHIPSKLKAGDWITIPLQTGFTYDSTKNMSILFMADSASPGNNPVSYSDNAARFPDHSVGRNDNTVDITGTPIWSDNAILDVHLNFSE
ncbi:MAG: hypothetical protein OEV42_08300 [Deltaproteobacteria bacterium]|nr:hypothetical protein [Deltaproteobacteria bacterium]